MTIAEPKKLHKELWLWLAENPSKSKRDWPQWKFNGGSLTEQVNDCFACSVSRLPNAFSDDCICEIIWPGGICEPGLFTDWLTEKDLAERSRLARQIANLPWGKS